ncbi:MAG: hypothetical protein HOH33_13045 [Verrucomicrobia bacterium]|jgi:sigma54-dependent transcription regulator|nr:hypothetical protein [Verrucomicrobiota bacterium]
MFREDLEPNLDFELKRFTEQTGQRVTLNAEARCCFLEFAPKHTGCLGRKLSET